MSIIDIMPSPGESIDACASRPLVPIQKAARCTPVALRVLMTRAMVRSAIANEQPQLPPSQQSLKVVVVAAASIASPSVSASWIARPSTRECVSAKTEREGAAVRFSMWGQSCSYSESRRMSARLESIERGRTGPPSSARAEPECMAYSPVL